jgi:hypothetical protein
VRNAKPILNKKKGSQKFSAGLFKCLDFFKKHCGNALYVTVTSTKLKFIEHWESKTLRILTSSETELLIEVTISATNDTKAMRVIMFIG